MSVVDPRQPVVILGGFLISDTAYQPMADWLMNEQGLAVAIAPASRFDWLLTSWSLGWRRLLDRVDGLVKELQSRSPSGKVTLVGHSSGGVMLRLYLSHEPFAGRVYAGAERCNRLITLGSPHQAERATPLRAMVDRRFPGCHAPEVDYVAVAGELDLNGPLASAFSRRSARGSYRSISGDPQVRGVRWMAFIGQFWSLTSLTPGGRNRVRFQCRPLGEFCLPESCVALHGSTSKGSGPG